MDEREVKDGNQILQGIIGNRMGGDKEIGQDGGSGMMKIFDKDFKYYKSTPPVRKYITLKSRINCLFKNSVPESILKVQKSPLNSNLKNHAKKIKLKR